MKYNLLQTKHYQLWVDKQIRFAEKVFINDIEERFSYIHNIFNIEEPYEEEIKKVNYFIVFDNAKNVIGNANKHYIICSMNQRIIVKPYLIPFVHEETHMIIQKRWNGLPAFWNEGMAEYVLLKLRRHDTLGYSNVMSMTNVKLIKIVSKYKTKSFYLDDLTWTLDNETFYEKCSMEETSYTAAAYLVELLINCYGITFLHIILDMIVARMIDEIRNFMLNESIVVKWIQYLELKLKNELG